LVVYTTIIREISCQSFSEIVVGGFMSYEVVEKAIRDDGMDYIALAGLLIWKPGLVNRWLHGDRRTASAFCAITASQVDSNKAAGR
jgi:2,4-dienoyl-CoA reductase-like NADH-dependent reductase (Old Yellow Enzyme family)